MRSYQKKKRYQMHVREQVLAGMHNRPDGSWSTTGSSAGVDHNVFHGMLGAEPGVGRPKKGGAVHYIANLALHAFPRWWPNNWDQKR
jgi:hypothetical protein